jgi:hypothetical protein
MTWNFRLVEASNLNDGEPWVQLAEVFYDEEYKPLGYSWVNMVGAESVEDMKQTLEWMAFAIGKPVLKQEDFKYPVWTPEEDE